MICQEVMEFMQRYIDGDLNQQETSLMMDHVGHCPDCAAMLGRLQRLSSELEQLPRVVPRYSLVDAILPELDRLHSEQSEGLHSEEIVTDTAPATLTRSNRPRRDVIRKISGVVAAGVIAGLLIFSQPQNWSFTGGVSNDEAAPAPMAAQMENVTEFSAKAKISDTAESSDMMKNSEAADGTGNQANEPDVSDATSYAPAEEFSAKDQFGEGIDKNDSASGSGEQESRGITSTENPDSSVTESSTSLTSKQPVSTEASVSPDEKWRAIAVQGSGIIQVYKTEDESEWFHSELREGQISLLSWNEDSTLLYYTHTDAEGRQTRYVFDILNVVESVR
ncbi:anti-sigma factor [Cohnella sp.]|uniref:anti-sigma factor family protein n=1 Tax=Cohnella sp. TaxID=1883426 RepID=UPI003566CE40